MRDGRPLSVLCANTKPTMPPTDRTGLEWNTALGSVVDIVERAVSDVCTIYIYVYICL